MTYLIKKLFLSQSNFGKIYRESNIGFFLTCIEKSILEHKINHKSRG